MSSSRRWLQGNCHPGLPRKRSSQTRRPRRPRPDPSQGRQPRRPYRARGRPHTSSAPYTVEQAWAVEQALALSRDDWREVQRALNELNHPAGPEDGLPGRRTRGALQAWQQAIGSRPTGHLTAQQHARLLEESAPKAAVVVTPGPIPSAQGAPNNECDRLAGEPSDPGRVGSGVEWRELEPEPALLACTMAMQQHPNQLRFQYQYGRALLRAGLIDDARLWFRSAAEQGYIAAQRSVGYMYMKGFGVPHDKQEAAAWYRRAAEQSDSRSQYLLGMMYAIGLGVTRDDAQSATWLRKAAELEEGGAQFILGWMYNHGRGVPQDQAEAAVWYRKAAEQGNQVASTALQRLSRSEVEPSDAG